MSVQEEATLYKNNGFRKEATQIKRVQCQSAQDQQGHESASR